MKRKSFFQKINIKQTPATGAANNIALLGITALSLSAILPTTAFAASATSVAPAISLSDIKNNTITKTTATDVTTTKANNYLLSPYS